MTGIAKKQFEESFGRTIFQKKAIEEWPLLMQALSLRIFSHFDLALAEKLLKKLPENELPAAFLCHLSLAVREGHLCVFKETGKLKPSPEELWIKNSIEPLPASLKSLMERLKKEEISLPKQILKDLSLYSSQTVDTPLCFFQGRTYFQKYWSLEYALKMALQESLNTEPAVGFNTQQLCTFVKNLHSNSILNDQQSEAIINASKTCFFILCGGPGTGKTYTAGHLIKAFWHAMSDEQKERYEIVLAAPTGKATSHLQKSLNICEEGLSIKASTLHSLLGLSAFHNQAISKKLSADLLIIDESSMMDIELFCLLMRSIKKGSRLILLGDPNQLPPVEAGSLFKDFIFYLKENIPQALTQLETCLRTERKELLYFSNLVKQGDSENLFLYMEQLQKQDIIQITELPSEKNAEEILNKAMNGLEKEWGLNNTQYDLFNLETWAKLLKNYTTSRLLSPLNLGPFGVQEINKKIHAFLSRKIALHQQYAIPIMITSNDHQLNLFNGEMGLLITRKRPYEKLEMEDMAIFIEQDSSSFRKVPALLLPKFEYAYCLSIHKSQGSEFERVLLLLPEGSERFGRELLYTGITRAKRKLELFCSKETLKKTIKNCSERISGYSKT